MVFHFLSHHNSMSYRQEKMVADESLNSLWNFRPPIKIPSLSLWGDTFTSFALDEQEQEMLATAIESLKVDTRTMLMAAQGGRLIALIDTLDRLGLAYHFERLIEDKILEIYNPHETHDLLITATRFRLLRQHQYHVSSGIFGKFTDQYNKFLESLATDVEGLLSLYEASHTRMANEVLLEEALTFTTHHLTSILPELQSPLKDKVKRALDHPLHKGVPIIEIQHYIRIYQRQDSRDALLVKLAKLNFKFLQNLYKKELCELSRWWNAFDLPAKMPFVRDRIVESYIWGLGFHFEPKYTYIRIAVGKLIQIAAVIDDAYDNYGTLHEDQLLTDAYERWDVNEIDGLPNVMQHGYRFVMGVYEDYVLDAAQTEKSFAVPDFAESLKQFARGLMKEQQWNIEKTMPPFKEYEENSYITSAITQALFIAVPGLKSVTREILGWVSSKPEIIVSTAMIGRYLNNLRSHERESKDGEVLTVVDYFMNEYGTSKQETLSKFKEMVEDHWKKLNEEWVNNTFVVPKEILEQLLNYARVMELTYKNSVDGYSSPETYTAHGDLFNGTV